MEKTKDFPLLKSGEYKVEKVINLSFFDLTGEKAKQKGTSNKSYAAEIQLSIKDNSAQIYTMWGAVGARQVEDWRHYSDASKARKEFESIIKSKLRKGYKEIDVAQRAYGSEEAKKITKAVSFKNIDLTDSNIKSNLHTETQRLITTLMGSTQSFVTTTLKCPLGQLSNTQIDSGRDILLKAKDLVPKTLNKSFLEKDKIKFRKEIENLTNDFYTLIPHNLGQGSRGKMEHLLLDDINKIVQKEDDLDTLLDAKAIGASLTSSSVDDQYKSLNTDFDFIDKQSDLFKWLISMVRDTRASNHRHLGDIILLNAWSIKRNGEFNTFLNTTEKIAKEYGKQVVPDVLNKLVKNRLDVEKTYDDLYKKANVVPLFHGSRSPNIGLIIRHGLQIKPSNVVLTGSMFGSGAYFGLSSKACNYTSINKSYWSQGSDDKAFMFIADVGCGNQKIATGPQNFSENTIRPHHSVWAQGGKSGVINDEFILFNTKQYSLKYLLEFTCK